MLERGEEDCDGVSHFGLLALLPGACVSGCPGKGGLRATSIVYLITLDDQKFQHWGGAGMGHRAGVTPWSRACESGVKRPLSPPKSKKGGGAGGHHLQHPALTRGAPKPRDSVLQLEVLA